VVHLARWCSPSLAAAVSNWVQKWESGRIAGATIPDYLSRYLANRAAVPPAYWSMQNEIAFLLIVPLEASGYRLPEAVAVEISEGRMFSEWLEMEIDTDDLPTCRHVRADGRTIEATLYPNDLREEFRNYFHTVWMIESAEAYFAERDALALRHLPPLIDHSRKALGIPS
jgi:hypothetical protein